MGKWLTLESQTKAFYHRKSLNFKLGTKTFRFGDKNFPPKLQIFVRGRVIKIEKKLRSSKINSTLLKCFIGHKIV